MLWGRLRLLLVSLALGACFSDSPADSTTAGSSGGTAGSGTTTTTDGGTVGPGTGGTAGAACTDGQGCAGGLVCDAEICVPCQDAGNPDGACAQLDPDRPVCDGAGRCAVCIASSCGGDAPVCDPMTGCRACTEHAECPDSACHLSGPEAGGCFDPGDVVQIPDLPAFDTALAAMGSGDQRVFVLGDGEFAPSGTTLTTGELAVLGSGQTRFTGGATSLLSADPGALLYLSNLTIDSGPSRAVSCNMCEALWIDDTTIADFAVAGVQSDSATHLRRSRIAVNNTLMGSAVVILAGGQLFAENSAFGPTSEIALSLTDATVDLRYVTIAGNQTAMDCTNTTNSGLVRNSIVVGVLDNGCFMLMFADNAVEEAGFGTQIGMYDRAWFVDPDGGDFHLSALGQMMIPTVADWDDGDPILDIDGDPHPDGSGFPGVDEP